jgi:hypothetical protein
MVNEINQMKINFNLGLIEQNKKNLEKTDYQVIKCYEASLLNEVMPYSLEELLAKRKQWRLEIDVLEKENKSMEE